jgi:hypothetical protein
LRGWRQNGPVPEDRDAWEELGASAGLCAHCVHPKLNLTRRGPAYLRCLRAEWDDRLPRYPRLPVLGCVGFERRDPTS